MFGRGLKQVSEVWVADIRREHTQWDEVPWAGSKHLCNPSMEEGRA